MDNIQTSPLKTLLDIAGINQVIWIDDFFSTPSEEELRIQIKSKIAELEVYHLKPIHKAFKGINFKADDPILQKQIEDVLYENSENLYELLDSITHQLKDQKPDKTETDEDLNPEQIEALSNAFENVSTYSYRKWKLVEKDVLSNCSEKTLILIDRDFDKEGASKNAGDDILAMAIELASSANCILLTHWVTQKETENLRKEIAADTSNGIEIYQFSVMSKAELGPKPEDAEPRLANALRVILTHRFCYDLAHESVSVMRDSLETAAYDLVNLSIYNLDQSIFENSLSEGASELDVLNRILFLRQRVMTKDKFANNTEIHEKLKKMREIRELSLIEHPSEIDSESISKLFEWRKLEVIDPKEHINPMHSPLTCGDIFQKTNSIKKFVLLAQPCDLPVRRNGQRSAKEAIFVGMVEDGHTADKVNPERYYKITVLENNGQMLIFDFRELAYVNLEVLDLAVFNNDGIVQINSDQNISSALLSGWIKKFERLKRRIPTNNATPPARILYLSLNRNLTGRKGTWDGNTWKFPYQRVGRIRSPYAEAILGSLAAFQTRAAFDHDFTKNLTEPEMPPE